MGGAVGSNCIEGEDEVTEIFSERVMQDAGNGDIGVKSRLEDLSKVVLGKAGSSVTGRAVGEVVLVRTIMVAWSISPRSSPAAVGGGDSTLGSG